MSVVVLSALALVVEVFLRLIDPSSAPKGITTVIVVVLFIGGIQLLCLAIIGSYLAHMYEEVKGRPSFIVESVLNRPEGPVSPGRGPSIAAQHTEYATQPGADDA
jgi:dolichol-phosphate mannosyltransferase